MEPTVNKNQSSSNNYSVNEDIKGLINHWFKIASSGYTHFVNTTPLGRNEDELWTTLNKRTGHEITPDHFAYRDEYDQSSIIGGLDVLLLSESEEVLENLIAIDEELSRFAKRFHDKHFYRSTRRFKVEGKKLNQLIDTHFSNISSILKVDFATKIKTVGEIISFDNNINIH